jgi:hypothetical protein
VQPDIFASQGRILRADEVQGVAERRNRRLERGLDIAAPQSQLGHLSLEVIEPRLGVLKHQVGPSLGLPHNHSGLLMRILPNLVGQLLGGQEGIAKVRLAFAVLAQQRFHLCEILALTVELTKGSLVVIGRLGEEANDFVAVKSTKCRSEAVLAQIEWGYLHEDPAFK